MLRLNSSKTLPILIYILESENFLQTQISNKLNISIGRVNKVVQYLMQKEIIIKENARYHLIQPNKLSEIIAHSLEIKKYVTYSLDISKEDLIDQLNDLGILCLDSALEKHFPSFKSSEVYVYEQKDLINLLNSINRGNTKVIVYKCPYESLSNGFTGRIQTIIDLLSVGKDDLAKVLSNQTWETRQ
jgi:predicted transcriptional regulator